MGLWGSKQTKEVNIKNPESGGQVFVTQNAIENLLRSAEEAQNPTQPAESNKVSDNNSSNSNDARLSPDLLDKRIAEYEKNMLTSFNAASAEVDNLFRERYQTVPVCLDMQKTVNTCYTDNRSQPLKCLDIANQFIKCIEKERQNRFGLTANPSS
jgi:hypothetical protein